MLRLFFPAVTATGGIGGAILITLELASEFLILSFPAFQMSAIKVLDEPSVEVIDEAPSN